MSPRSDIVILATGTRYRTLGVPGEAEGLGSYVLQSSAQHAAAVAGRPVAVVGGGDAASENALNLARVGCAVTLLMRSEPRARESFREQVAADPNIEVLPIPTTITSLEPRDDGCRLHLDDDSILDVAALFVRISVDPVLPELSPMPERDREGYLVVDREGRTSLPGLLAAGDVTDLPLRGLATAMGAGARAAKIAQPVGRGR